MIQTLKSGHQIVVNQQTYFEQLKDVLNLAPACRLQLPGEGEQHAAVHGEHVAVLVRAEGGALLRAHHLHWIPHQGALQGRGEVRQAQGQSLVTNDIIG